MRRWCRGSAIAAARGLTLHSQRIETNMVIFRVDRSLGTAASFVERMAQQRVRALPFGPQLIRLVTHLDINRDQAHRAAEIIVRIAESSPSR